MAHSVKPITKVKLGREGGLMTPTEVAELAGPSSSGWSVVEKFP